MRFLYENVLVWLGPYIYLYNEINDEKSRWLCLYLLGQPNRKKHEILQWVCDLQAVHTSF